MKHIKNIKPLVGLNNLKTQNIILDLLDDISNHPTIGDIENSGLISLRDYNPGQYITRGVEDYARRLFLVRYGARGKISFIIKEIKENKIKICPIKQKDSICEINLNCCIYSLRSPAGVSHFNITGKEEFALINGNAIPYNFLKVAGITNLSNFRRAIEDLKKAYDDLAGNILLVRRARLTSPNIYYLTFFSENKIIGPSAPMICVQTDDFGLDKSKLLTLYLNSSISLLQLIGFAVETEGAWVAFQGDQVWSQIHIPNFEMLSENIYNRALKVFDEISKLNVDTLFNRYKNRSPIQRLIDEVSLEMLGLEDWKNKLDDIYEAITGELQAMLEILEKSKKSSKRKMKIERRKGREEFRQLTLPST